LVHLLGTFICNVFYDLYLIVLSAFVGRYSECKSCTEWVR
jgi:hypothetical protein